MGKAPPAISTRIEHKSRSKAKGQRRHDMREGPQPKYVNADRTTENSVLMEPTKESALAKICDKRTARQPRQRARKSNAAIATCGIVTFSKEAQPIVDVLPPDEQDRLLLDTARRLADAMGTTLHGAVVHRDETALHMHYQLAAVRTDGRPISKVVDTKHLQDAAAAAWSHLGIERGTSKQARQERGEPASAWAHRSVKQLHEDLPAEIDAAEHDAGEQIKAANARAAEAEEEVKEVEEKLRKTEERLKTAETKAAQAEAWSGVLSSRITTYRNRLENHERQLKKAASDLEAAREEIRRLSEDPDELPKPKQRQVYTRTAPAGKKWGGLIETPAQYDPRKIKFLEPQPTREAFGRLEYKKKQAEEETIYQKRAREEAEKAYRRLQANLIRPIAAPEPIEDDEAALRAALWATQEEIVTRYRVQMQVDAEMARVPPQEGVTDRQIAAALYSIGRDLGWERRWFDVSDSIASEIISMAIEDDCLDSISFRTDSAADMLDEARADDARLRDQEAAAFDPDPDPLGDSPPPRPKPRNGPSFGM